MPGLSENALIILRERYLRRDAAGQETEDAGGMFRRVARAVAQPARSFGEDEDYWAERFLMRLERLQFLPNSPTLMNAGLSGGQLAACFVLPVRDDLDSIFGAMALAARIQQTGGGTGFSFSSLRPRGDTVSTTGGASSGPLSFTELFDHATAVIRAGGRRRGANMAVLRADHPDIEEFITAKLKPSRLENFNLSIGMTDAFFDAFAGDDRFVLKNPRTGLPVSTVSAKRLFTTAVEAAWASGDPGLVFLDEINRLNPLPDLGPIEATNPCGEQPLLPYESCTLGSLNLAAFVSANSLDWAALEAAIGDAVVFLDNVIEANSYPASEIAAATLLTRKIGLGVMGLADMLAELGIAYDSPAAIDLGEQVAAFMTEKARAASIELGRRRGSFPAFSRSLWPGRGVSALRNATVTCVAPTGTVSMIAGCSSGIEPFFALATARRVLDGRIFYESNRVLDRALSSLDPPSRERVDALIRETGSIRTAGYLDEALKRRFPIALEIAPAHHLRMQAAFQKHVDAAVAKTVNLPADCSSESVREAFLLAHELRLKGVTVYRYGSKGGQALSLVHDERVPDCRECAV